MTVTVTDVTSLSKFVLKMYCILNSARLRSGLFEICHAKKSLVGNIHCDIKLTKKN